jgi:uncharacterized protein YggU (UPF0235/DUF167 family)
MLDELKTKKRVRVFLKPCKPASRIVGFDAVGNLVVEVDAPATQNRANLAMLKLLKQSGLNAFLEKGHRGRYKTVRLK